MSRVYVGNIDPRATERELEDEFRVFGVLRSVWVARKPPGFAFVEFDDLRDAHDAIREMDGKNGWRVELSRSSAGGNRGRGGDDMKCYECGEPGHFARECRLRIGAGGSGTGGRGRSRSPMVQRYRRSPSYGQRHDSDILIFTLPSKNRSPLRRSRSPRRRSLSPLPPRRGRSFSDSPPPKRDHRLSPFTNGNQVKKDDRRSRSRSRSHSHSHSP